LVLPAFVVCAVHLVKRKGRLKPATTAQFFLMASERLPLMQRELYRLTDYMSRDRAAQMLQTTAILNDAICGC
jgi:hypothetical protein